MRIRPSIVVVLELEEELSGESGAENIHGEEGTPATVEGFPESETETGRRTAGRNGALVGKLGWVAEGRKARCVGGRHRNERYRRPRVEAGNLMRS